jgi:hypothetical protein
MISPRSQEAQYNSAMHYQSSAPYTAGSINGSQPPNVVSHSQFQPQNSAVPPTFQSPNAYNVNNNSNYTTSAAIPPTGANSFSLPSSNHSVFYDQQGQGQLIQQHSHSPTGGQAPPQVQHLTKNIHGQQMSFPPYSHPQTDQEDKGGQRFLPYQAPLPYYATQTPGTAPVNSQNEYPYQFIRGRFNTPYADPNQPPPPQQQQQQSGGVHPPPMNTSQSLPNIAAHPSFGNNPISLEDAPFPGVLEPQYHPNPSYHPRSATYPNDNANEQKKVGSGLSTNPFLGMTPETARRNRCNICQKQFKRPSSLQTHLYSHTGEKPFVCDWDNCGRLFSVRSNMIRHKKLHERDSKLKKETGEELKSDAKSEHTPEPQGRKPHGTSSTGSLPNSLYSAENPANAQSDFQLGW